MAGLTLACFNLWKTLENNPDQGWALLKDSQSDGDRPV